MTEELHTISIRDDRETYMMRSGHRAVCSCGWTSDCYSQMTDTRRAADVHVRRSSAVTFQTLLNRSSIGAALNDIKDRGIDAHLADLDREMKHRRRAKAKL